MRCFGRRLYEDLFPGDEAAVEDEPLDDGVLDEELLDEEDELLSALAFFLYDSER
jgi:hypothetical protein